MKILIAGLGSIGRRHLKNLVALGEDDILLYRTHRGTMPEAALADFPMETDLQAALEHKPQAVIVSNPTSLHLEVAIPAALAGCHLLLEKPIAASMERVDEFQVAVEQSGVRVLVGYQFRFHPGLQRVKNFIEEGAIGRALSVRAHWGEYLPDWHPWEDYRLGYSARADLGGGVVLTLSHPFDYLRWLFGEVSALWAFTGQLSDLDLEVEDVAEIGLRFNNGVQGSLHLDYFQRPARHQLEVIGTQGTIRWDNETGSTWICPVASSDWEEHPAPPGFERNDLFLAQMKHFLGIIRGSDQPVCTLQDGVRALELSLAAVEAGQNGQLMRW